MIICIDLIQLFLGSAAGNVTHRSQGNIVFAIIRQRCFHVKARTNYGRLSSTSHSQQTARSRHFSGEYGYDYEFGSFAHLGNVARRGLRDQEPECPSVDGKIQVAGLSRFAFPEAGRND